MVRTAITDLSARKKVEQQLIEARREADGANRAKSEFLAHMSHELRTPMNAILGMTELALADNVTAATRDYLQTVKDAGASLLELLNDLLDFSRIEAGRVDFEHKLLSLTAIVEQTLKTLGVRAYEKGLELVTDLPADVLDAWIGDPMRLRQVLLNLVGNAIKFTSQGQIIVSARMRAEAGPQLLEFAVTDTGCGIAPADQQRIFSPFTQADSSRTRDLGGSGLGLTICHRLVEMMGGRIEVESQPGRGSTFRFTVRFQVAPQQPILDHYPWLSNRSVLVVESNPASRAALVNICSQWGMLVASARSALEAIGQIEAAEAADRPFNAVILDGVRPSLETGELLKHLPTGPGGSKNVIVMYSSAVRDGLGRNSAAGAVFVEKPIARAELLTALNQALGIIGRDTPFRPATTLEEKSPMRLRVLLAEDNRANQKLARYILERRGHEIEIVENGQETVDRVRHGTFDAVLMDVQMPVMGGYEATAAIRGLPDPAKSRIPIIAMTTHAMKEDQHRCLAAGMDAYLSKPIEGSKLISLVERLARAQV